VVHVPYRGNLQAVADLVDGRVQAGLIATFQSEWTETKKAGGAAA
jgi:tripartite-type tricarboxylate transporter receptor subunit TctC